MYPLAIEITSKFYTEFTSTPRTAIEFSATTFSNAFTYTALSSIESGVITRQWWKRQGRDQLVQLSWGVLQALLLLAVLSICFGLWTVHAARATWVWLNRATDDGLGLYGPSPMLANWFGESNCQAQDVVMLEGSTDTEKLIGWAVSRWPQLEKIENGQ